MTLGQTAITAEYQQATNPLDWGRQVLNSLDNQARDILWHYYAQGDTVEQISKDLAVPTLKILAIISDAKQLMARALKVRHRSTTRHAPRQGR
jgi:hypothetical protein